MPQLLPPNMEENTALFQAISTLASETTKATWNTSTEALAKFAQQLSDDIWKPLAENASQPLIKFLNEMVQYGTLRSEDAAAIKRALVYEGDVNWILQLFMTLGLFGSFIGQIMEAPGLKMQQGINKQIRPQIPYVQEIIAAAFIAPEKTTEVRELLARSGYSEEAIDILFLSNYRLYDEFHVRDLWLRKEIDDSRMYERMRELGYTDTRIGELTKLWEIIPPVNDILTMVAHEAFEPDAVQLMGLDSEFPESQSEWLTKQGLSPFWQRQYWRSHWEQPSIQMGFEMLHRGVIDSNTLDMLFRTVELPPFWRGKLTEIAYQPYTRVDVRRMFDLGVLGEGDLKKAYTDIGYDDVHADNMVEFTKRYNQDPTRDLTKTNIIGAYKDKILTRADTITLLTDIRYTDAQAQFFVELADFEEQKEIRDTAISTIQAKYTNGLIDRGQAQSQLDALNLPAAQVSLLLEKWSIALIENPRLPSKSDLDNFYVAGIINVDQYTMEMKRLGYGATYVSWYRQAAEIVKAKKNTTK